MVVIGNKSDMKKDRAVTKEEGRALAEDFGASFLEVSVWLYHVISYPYYWGETNVHSDLLTASQAKENTKVKEAFETLVKKVLKKSPKAGVDTGDAAGGVFGGGKADP